MEQELSAEQKSIVDRALKEVSANRGMATVYLGNIASKEVTEEAMPCDAASTAAHDAAAQIKTAMQQAQATPSTTEVKKNGKKVKSREAEPVARKNMPNPSNLNALKSEVYPNMDGKENCGVCGKRFAMGDVYYGVNLSDYGYNDKTEKVCMKCIEEIKKEFS